MSQNRVIDPRAAERRRSLLIMIISAIVLIAVAAVVIIWAVNKDSDDTDAVGGSEVPTVVTKDGAIRVTKAPAGTDPAAVVTLIEDFQCPACHQFETSYGPTLAKLAENPNVAIDYKTITFLDNGGSTTKYSSRSANASLCVAEATGKDGDMSTWLKFHNLLFQNQPDEGGEGLSNAKLKELAKEAGAPDVNSCIDDKSYGQWLQQQNDAVVSDSSFAGTPTVKINGKKVELSTPEAFEAAVLAAASAPAQ
ncbi:DsbA family protein [Gordonia sp. VNK21]|uniref:DsbA family protein n=1 Tax=Gordonia sp. VNK21 TaxID=3382483 RepID=UPI0038D49F70